MKNPRIRVTDRGNVKLTLSPTDGKLLLDVLGRTYGRGRSNNAYTLYSKLADALIAANAHHLQDDEPADLFGALRFTDPTAT